MNERFLLTRKEAAERYSISQRQFDELYRRNPDFPIIRVGKRVLVHREKADEFFTRNLRAAIQQ